MKLSRVLFVAIIFSIVVLCAQGALLDKNTNLVLPRRVIINDLELENKIVKTIAPKALFTTLTLGTYGEYGFSEYADTQAFVINFYRNLDRELMLVKIRSFVESVKSELTTREYQLVMSSIASLKDFIKPKAMYRDVIVVAYDETTNALYLKYLNYEEGKDMDTIPLTTSDIVKENCSAEEISEQSLSSMKDVPSNLNICTLLTFIAKSRIYTMIPK